MMTHRCKQQPLRGFTLLEVLIALALIGALLSAMFAFYLNLLNTRERVREQAALMRAADVMIEHVERSLTYCIAGDAAFGPGVTGDERSIHILTRSVAVHDAARRSVSAAAALHDLHRLSLFSTPDGPIAIRHIAVRPGQSQSSQTSRSGAAELAERMGLVRLRYHDGAGWVNQFDSLRAGRLPRAVEIAIWFTDPREESMDDQFEDLFEEDNQFNDEFFDPFEDSEDLWRDDDLLDDRERWPLPDRVRIVYIPGADTDEVEEDTFGLMAASRSEVAPW